MDMNAVFTQFRDKLDAHYDRRERLVKISRDITALSKKMIFSLQRIQGEITALPPNIKKEVENREGEIQKLLEKAEPDVRGPNAYRYHRQISPGIQEYVEALTFRHYILHKSIASPSELQKSYFASVPLSNEDYILGLADLTGELMRRAISNISSRNSVAPEIRTTLRHLFTAFEQIYLPPAAGIKFGFPADLRAKIDVMKSSLAKVEDACYNVHVRGSEVPEGWTLDFIRDDQESSRHKRVERDDGEEGGGGKRRRVDDDD